MKFKNIFLRRSKTGKIFAIHNISTHIIIGAIKKAVEYYAKREREREREREKLFVRQQNADNMTSSFFSLLYLTYLLIFKSLLGFFLPTLDSTYIYPLKMIISHCMDDDLLCLLLLIALRA